MDIIQRLLAGDDGTGPKTYLNWLIFDKNYTLIDGGFTRLSSAPREDGQNVPHERMYSPDITINQPGYAYIYLSNEETTPVDVYFDDFALCLLTICNSLVQEIRGQEEFEFTESEAKIVFQRDGDIVRITTSFSAEILEMSFEDFQKAIKKFYKDVIFDVLGKNQALRNNTTFSGYLKEAEKM